MKLLTIILILIFLLASPASALAATLSLSPASGTFNKGCAFNLEIKLDTGEQQTDGTDAIILYDQGKLTATTPTAGTIYADYPGTNVDENSGKITISGLASVSSAFSGQGTLATLHFTVKDTSATGATMIKFDFDSNDRTKTTDSNVVQRGTVADVLSSVVNGNYTIGTGACGGGATATPAPSVSPQTGQGGQGEVSVVTPPAQLKTIDQLVDKTGKGPGTPQLTYTIAILGSVLTILGILGLALL